MISVFFEDISPTPNFDSEFLVSWISKVVESENKMLGEISYVFCSDEYLLEMNREHLNHDYYTDIITFDYCFENIVSGDLFISIDRVLDNAKEFSSIFKDELDRVCVHGVLHLCGYKDKSEADEVLMRSKEDEKLLLR
jgi:rRNA maturation RNase YbeY